MFTRFVVPLRDEDSHHLTGVFGAAYELRDRGVLARDEEYGLRILMKWFQCNLPIPERFSRSRRRDAQPKAICWLKEGVRQHFDKMRELAAVLERHGILTRALRTSRPGYVVYEDDFQIAAVPFRDTNA
jgi:hypothetical protein